MWTMYGSFLFYLEVYPQNARDNIKLMINMSVPNT